MREKKNGIRGERRSVVALRRNHAPARGAHDAGHAIRAVQCRDLRGLGRAARRFHKEALAYVNNVRYAFDIEYFHWSSPRFTAFWWQAFSVCTASEWGRIGLAAFKGDWAQRIQAFDLLEFPGLGVAAN